MFLMLARPMMAGFMLVAAGPRLPEIDMRRACMAASGGDGMQKCMIDELYAKKKLLKYWSKTPLAFKEQCALDPPPPDPSYLVLRDCINNNTMLHGKNGSDAAE